MSNSTPPRAIVAWLAQHPSFDAIAGALVAEYARQNDLCTDCSKKLESTHHVDVQGDHEVRGKLSQRQLLILRGMVEGKTNHELANELGFSVSTIRHETMRIYEILAVSDRKEAAKKALAQALV